MIQHISAKDLGIITILITIIGTITSSFLLMDRGPLIWIPFTLALPATLTHLGAALLLWKGLDGFKDELRDAYKYICIAIVFVGYTQIQLPFLSILGWWQLLENGIVLIPFIIPFIFFSIGIRRFARLLSIHSNWASPWLINIAGILLGALLTLLPHAPNNTDPLAFAFTLVLLGWVSVHAFALIVMTLKIKHAIGLRYVNAMAWLNLTYVSVLTITVLYILTLFTLSPGHWYVDYNISIAPFIIIGLLWLRAGYAFNLATSPNPIPNHLGPFFGPTPQQSGPVSSIDIIVHVATLASDPKEIDPLLDGLRAVTAKITPGQPLSQADQASLANVYKRLENYLISNDPLRKFTQSELRETISLSFAQDALSQTFWPSIEPTR